jgi:hypothetical protein
MTNLPLGGDRGRFGSDIWRRQATPPSPAGEIAFNLQLGCREKTMRRVWILGLALALAACANPPAAKLAANPADGPGCLGVPAETCVRWLQATMSLDEGFIPAALARRHRVDVNGRPADGGLISLTGKVPGGLEPLVILIRLRPDDTVISVEASLPGNLMAARTEDVYDQSGLYEIVARLLGRRCPNLARLDLYRFFENSLKPRIVAQRQDVSAGLFGLHKLTSRAADVPYCGASFTYTNYTEWHGSAELGAGRNYTGYSSIEVK